MCVQLFLLYLGTDVVPISPVPAFRVFILYSDDHELHNNTVKMLASFLQNFCNLQVRLDMWFATEIGNKKYWLYDEIITADKVLIIFSKGTWKKWQAAANQKQTETGGLNGEFGDMFLPGYNYAVQDIEKNPDLLASKYVAAYFEYSKKEHVLPDLGNVAKYQIPKNLEELYFRLHNITQHTPRSSRRAFGLLSETYHKVSKEGKALYDAIEKIKATIKDMPDWYEKATKGGPDEGYGSHQSSQTDRPELAGFFQRSSSNSISSTYSSDFDEFYELPKAQGIDCVGNPDELADVNQYLPSPSIDFPVTYELISVVTAESDLLTEKTADKDSYQYENPEALNSLDEADVQIQMDPCETDQELGIFMPDYRIHGGHLSDEQTSRNNSQSPK